LTVAKRQNEILDILKKAKEPVAARDLANRFGISRQVIVQDLAVLRVANPDIISTYRGYVMQTSTAHRREFKVRHEDSRTEDELTLIVDLGGHVVNVSISHKIYGRVTAELNVSSRQDVQEFMAAMRFSRSRNLSNATNGFHYHLVEAASEERLDQIEKALEEQGFLAPLTTWEME